MIQDVKNFKIIGIFIIIVINILNCSFVLCTDSFKKEILFVSETETFIKIFIPCNTEIQQKLEDFKKTEYIIPGIQNFSIKYSEHCQKYENINPNSQSVRVYIIIDKDNFQCELQYLEISENCGKDMNISITTGFLEDDGEINYEKGLAILQNSRLEVNNLNAYISNFEFRDYQSTSVEVSRCEKAMMKNCKFIGLESPYSFLYQAYITGKSVIEDCIFENSNNTKYTGGGMYIQHSNTIVYKNVVFVNCQTTSFGSSLDIYNLQSVEIYGVEIKNNDSQSKGGLSIRNVVNVYIDDIYFHDNIQSGNGAGLLIEQCTDIVIKNSKFQNNIAKVGYNGGGALIQFTINSIILENIKFIDNKGQNGAGIYVNVAKKIKVSDSQFYKNKGLNGSGIYIEKIEDIEIYDTLFEENDCMTLNGNGGGLLINNDLIDGEIVIQLNNLDFIKNKGGQGGGLFLKNILNSKILEIKNINIKNNQSQELGAGIIFQNIKGLMNVDNLTFLENISENSGGGLVIIDCQNCNFQNLQFTNNQSLKGSGAGINIMGSKNNNIIFQDIILINNNALGEGSSIKAQNINNLQLFNININDSQSYEGIIIITQINNSLLQNINIQDSKIYQNGFILQYSQNIEINNLFINNLIAENINAGIKFNNNQDLYIDNMKIYNNTVKQSNGAGSILNSNNLTIKNSLVQNNEAQLNVGGLYINNCVNFNFENSQIENNLAEKNAGGIQLVDVYDSNFINLQIFNNHAQRKTGGGIIINTGKNLQFLAVIVKNNKAKEGGGLYITESELIKFQNTWLEDNTVLVSGGAAYIIESKNLVFESTQFLNNQAILNGGALQFIQTINIQFKDSQFTNNKGNQGSGGGIYAIDNNDDIKINNVVFQNNTSKISGGGIYLQQSGNMTINYGTFQENNGGQFGSSIFISQSQNIFLNQVKFNQNLFEIQEGGFIFSQNLQSFQIENCNFSDSQVFDNGGSLYLQDIQKLYIRNNIIKNSKQIGLPGFADSGLNFGKGGSIFIQNIEILDFVNNSVEQSHAYFYGGAISIYNAIQNNIVGNTIQNSSVVYDSKFKNSQKNSKYILSQGGGIYIEFKDIQNLNEIYQNYQQKINLQHNKFDGCQASSGGGVFININFGLKFEQFIINNQDFKNNYADVGPGMRIIGNNTQDLQLYLSKQINKFQNNTGAVVENQDIFFGYTSNENLQNMKYAQFQLCSQGQNLKQGGQEFCDKCDKNGVCEGGYIKMYPNKEYWRESKDSVDFIYCYNNPEACLGNDQCQEGYTGTLCENCNFDKKYASKGNKCYKCANKTQLWVNLIIMFLVTCLLLANQIYGVNSRVKKRLIQKCVSRLFDICFQKIGQLSGVTKIFLMHFQIIYLVAVFTIEFPFEVTNFVQVLGNPSKQFTNSVKCLMLDNTKPLNQYEYKLSYYGLAITIATLLFLILMQIISYFCGKFIKKRENLISFMKCSFICFFLMVQPGFLQNSMQFLVCRDIGQNSYNSADINIDCKSNFYYRSILPINVSVVVIIGFLIPLLLGIIIYKEFKKGSLKQIIFQRTMGILFMEFQDRYYYWEVISLITCFEITNKEDLNYLKIPYLEQNEDMWEYQNSCTIDLSPNSTKDKQKQQQNNNNDENSSNMSLNLSPIRAMKKNKKIRQKQKSLILNQINKNQRLGKLQKNNQNIIQKNDSDNEKQNREISINNTDITENDKTNTQKQNSLQYLGISPIKIVQNDHNFSSQRKISTQRSYDDYLSSKINNSNKNNNDNFNKQNQIFDNQDQINNEYVFGSEDKQNFDYSINSSNLMMLGNQSCNNSVNQTYRRVSQKQLGSFTQLIQQNKNQSQVNSNTKRTSLKDYYQKENTVRGTTGDIHYDIDFD